MTDLSTRMRWSLGCAWVLPPHIPVAELRLSLPIAGTNGLGVKEHLKTGWVPGPRFPIFRARLPVPEDLKRDRSSPSFASPNSAEVAVARLTLPDKPLASNPAR